MKIISHYFGGLIGALMMCAFVMVGGPAVASEPAQDVVYTFSHSDLFNSDAVLLSAPMVTNDQHQANMQKITSLVSLAALRPVDISIMVKAKSTVIRAPHPTPRPVLIE